MAGAAHSASLVCSGFILTISLWGGRESFYTHSIDMETEPGGLRENQPGSYPQSGPTLPSWSWQQAAPRSPSLGQSHETCLEEPGSLPLRVLAELSFPHVIDCTEAELVGTCGNQALDGHRGSLRVHTGQEHGPWSIYRERGWRQRWASRGAMLPTPFPAGLQPHLG